MDYDSTTGKIVTYIGYAPLTDRNYVSDLSPQSNEEDFIQYVKKILLEQSGVSVDGRKMRFGTKVIYADGSYEYFSEFVNHSDSDPNFNAEYTFFFSADIDGIARPDEIRIRVTNFGVITDIQAMVNDEAYLPFQDVKIDQDRIIEIAEKACPYGELGINGDTTSTKTTLKLLVDESALWVEAMVTYNIISAPTIDNPISSVIGTGGAIYLFKVAELK